MSLNFLTTDQENALTTKHLKSYLMSIYVNVALDLTNYLAKKWIDLYPHIYHAAFIKLCKASPP